MRIALLALVSLLATGSAPAFADSIPYSNPGQLATANTLTATATGTITGYFVSSDAANNDTIELWDTTKNTFSGFLIPNHSSTVGSQTLFLNVNAGDNLVFLVYDSSIGETFDSLNNNGIATNYSADGYNHVYTTAYSGGISGLPANLVGTYVGAEDLPVTSLKPLSGSDLDYNDDNFVFTDVEPAAPTPEPSSFILFGSGLIGAAGILRRKFSR